MATDLPTQVLQAVGNASSLPLMSTDAFPGVESSVLKGALDSLNSREMVVYKTIDREEAVLTDEAQSIVNDGSHEAKVYEAVCGALGGLKISELPVCTLSRGERGGRNQVIVLIEGVETRWREYSEGWAGESIEGGMD